MKMDYSPAKAWLICQVWAFLLFIPTSAEFTVASNRYLLHWSTTHLVVLMGLIAGLGTTFFGIGVLLRACCPGAYRPVAGISAIVTLAMVGWYLLRVWTPGLFLIFNFSPLAILLAAALTAILLQRGFSLERLRLGLARAALFMSAVLPVFVIAALSYPTYEPAPELPLEQVPDRAARGKLHSADNVYVFVFDAWPLRFTLQEGKPHDRCPNLQRLASEMCVFTEGHSPGCHTVMSLPRLLYERDDEYVLRDGKPGFWRDGVHYDSRQQPTIFARARELDFRTYMIGWHHDYHAMLGGQVDYLRQVSYNHLVGNRPAEIAAGFAWTSSRHLLGPALSNHFGSSKHFQLSYALQWHNEKLIDLTRKALQDPRPRGQFCVFHLPIPHHPFIYKKDGKLRSFDHEPTQYVPLCKEQVSYLDQLIGEFMDSLKKQGKYDSSLIVLTSDHTWRFDPDVEPTAADYTHVPLFIHFPGQKKNVRIDAPFTTNNLFRLAELVDGRAGNLTGLNELIRKRQWYSPVSDAEVHANYVASK